MELLSIFSELGNVFMVIQSGLTALAIVCVAVCSVGLVRMLGDVFGSDTKVVGKSLKPKQRNFTKSEVIYH